MCHCGFTAQGDNMNSIAEETATSPAPAAGEQPKATKKAAAAPRRAPVAPAKGKAGKKATPVKKVAKGGKKRARSPRCATVHHPCRGARSVARAAARRARRCWP